MSRAGQVPRGDLPGGLSRRKPKAFSCWPGSQATAGDHPVEDSHRGGEPAQDVESIAGSSCRFGNTQVAWHRGDLGEPQVTGLAALLHSSPDVVRQWDGEAVYLARLPEGPIVVVDGVGELIWDEMPGRTRLSAVERVAEALGVAPGQIAPDVEAFLDALIDLGFIREAG
jgi:hypothetical protein